MLQVVYSNLCNTKNGDSVTRELSLVPETSSWNELWSLSMNSICPVNDSGF